MALPQLELMTIVLVMVVLARVAGELLLRKKQSPIIGEVLVGILLGPYVLRLVDPQRDIMLMAEIKGIAELGIFFLIFHAGVELSMKELGTSFRKSMAVIFSGLAIPFLLSTVVVLLLGFSLATGVFLGLCLSLTALPVSIRVLSDLGRLQSIEGRTIIVTAIGNDIGAMIILAVLLSLGTDGTLGPEVVGMATFKVTIFIIIVYVFSRLLTIKMKVEGREIAAIRHYLNRMVNALKSKESLFAITVLFVLAFGGLAVMMGFHFIIGAFFGSVLISRQMLGKENYAKVGGIISAISMGFIAPIFFVYIGLSFYIASYELLYMVPVFIVVYVAGKYTGGYLGGNAMGLGPAGSKAVATGIANPGTMELIVASIGVNAGLISVEQFSLIVVMVIVMMIVTPIALKRAFERVDRENGMPGPGDDDHLPGRYVGPEIIEVRSYDALEDNSKAR